MDTTYNLNGGVKPTLERFADFDGPDFTPVSLIDNDPFDGTIWEPAGSDGYMAEVLKLTGNLVVGSDLVDREY